MSQKKKVGKMFKSQAQHEIKRPFDGEHGLTATEADVLGVSFYKCRDPVATYHVILYRQKKYDQINYLQTMSMTSL